MHFSDKPVAFGLKITGAKSRSSKLALQGGGDTGSSLRWVMELPMSRSRKIMAFAAVVQSLSLTGAYAQLENRPPVSERPAMTADEISKLKKDLAGTRDRQNARVKGKEASPAPKSKRPDAPIAPQAQPN